MNYCIAQINASNVCMSHTAFVVILHCLPTKYNDVDTHNIKKKENNFDVNVLTKIDSTMDEGLSRSNHINYSPPTVFLII